MGIKGRVAPLLVLQYLGSGDLKNYYTDLSSCTGSAPSQLRGLVWHVSQFL